MWVFAGHVVATSGPANYPRYNLTWGVTLGDARSPAYRADIDGLRAVAVLAVVAFHAYPKSVRGGFVGVDVFFVISGFLISGIILSDLRSGSFSFLNFYARRVRRLFPALIAVLLAVLALGYATMVPGDYAALGEHTLAAAAFAGNVLNYTEAGYFDLPASQKPLLHLWSLGVEEQFYFLFPAILIGIWRVKTARLLLAALGAASFILNIALVRHYPSFTFYLPLTRFWEFIAGALLAWSLIAMRLPQSRCDEGNRIRDAASVVGIVLIFGGIILARKTAFPGWMAILPVAGTAFIIWAGPNAWLNRNVLSRPWLVFIGLISYPLYLWHWPLLVFARNWLNLAPGVPVRSLAVSLSFVLSWATYRFVETPIRNWRPSGVRWRTPVALAAGIAATAFLGAFITNRSGLPERYPPEIAALLAPLKLGSDYPPDADNGNAPGPTVVVFGDSHAGHLMPGLRRLQSTRPFTARLMGWGYCSPWGDKAWGGAGLLANEDCKARIDANEKALKEIRPEIVILAGFWREYEHLERVSETIQFLHEIGVRRVVIVGSVPYWGKPPQMLLLRAYQADPARLVPDRLQGFDRITLELDGRLKKVADQLGAVFVSSYDTLCNEAGCLVRLGNTAREIIQVDLTHFSAAGSRFLVAHIQDRIFGEIGSNAASAPATSALP